MRLSLALLAAAAAWIVRQVAFGFVVTTLGEPWLGLPESARSWLAPLGVPFVRGPVGTLLLGLLGVPGVIRASRRIRGAPWYAVVPTTSGCLTMRSGQLDTEGKLAIVGGYEPAFFEPAWVVVWSLPNRGLAQRIG